MSGTERLTLAQYRREMGLPVAQRAMPAYEPQLMPKAPRRNKYNVGPRHLRQVDGYTFDSIAERRRYEELRALELAGSIDRLRVHPSWPLVVNDIPVSEYEADFAYLTQDGEGDCTAQVVEDVKGVVTPVYRLKRALLFACYGIEILETGAKP